MSGKSGSNLPFRIIFRAQISQRRNLKKSGNKTFSITLGDGRGKTQLEHGWVL